MQYIKVSFSTGVIHYLPDKYVSYQVLIICMIICHTFIISIRIRTDMVDGRIPKIYPSVVSSYEINEYGLLTEDQLLSFYYSELYETAEDFVDAFIKVVS